MKHKGIKKIQIIVQSFMLSKISSWDKDDNLLKMEKAKSSASALSAYGLVHCISDWISKTAS